MVPLDGGGEGPIGWRWRESHSPIGRRVSRSDHRYAAHLGRLQQWHRIVQSPLRMRQQQQLLRLPESWYHCNLEGPMDQDAMEGLSRREGPMVQAEGVHGGGPTQTRSDRLKGGPFEYHLAYEVQERGSMKGVHR